MITGAFFNHICWICPQNRRIYRFFANVIIIFSAATLHAVGFKAENPGLWGRAPVLFSFEGFFLIPQVKYSVMLLQSQIFRKFFLCYEVYEKYGYLVVITLFSPARHWTTVARAEDKLNRPSGICFSDDPTSVIHGISSKPAQLSLVHPKAPYISLNVVILSSSSLMLNPSPLTIWPRSVMLLIY